MKTHCEVMTVARHQIPNTHQLPNFEAVISTRSVRQLLDATMEELLIFCFLCGPCRDVISRQSVELVQLSGVE
jgi:hypothetical protein